MESHRLALFAALSWSGLTGCASLLGDFSVGDGGIGDDTSMPSSGSGADSEPNDAGTRDEAPVGAADGSPNAVADAADASSFSRDSPAANDGPSAVDGSAGVDALPNCRSKFGPAMTVCGDGPDASGKAISFEPSNYCLFTGGWAYVGTTPPQCTCAETWGCACLASALGQNYNCPSTLVGSCSSSGLAIFVSCQ